MNLTITVADEVVRRARIRAPEQGTSVNAILRDFLASYAGAELVRRAIDSARRYRIAVWDALIVEAARSRGCERVLSEDLHAGQSFDGVVIENPFDC